MQESRFLRPSIASSIARLLPELLKARLHDIGLPFLGGLMEDGQVLRRDDVIIVDKGDILPLRHLQAERIRAGRAAVPSTLHQPDARVFCRIRFLDVPASIVRAVVDEDQLEIRKRLRKDAVEAGREVWRDVVDRYDDRDFRHCQMFPSYFHPSTSGMARWMVVPLPRALSIVMRMSCCSAIQTAMERPRPVPLTPSAFVREVSTR